MADSWRQRADAALVALTRDRWQSLTGYGYLLTGDHQEGEDLAQEAIVRTFARARSVDPGAIEGYVRRAMVTISIDGHRRRGRWRARLHLLAGPDAAPGPDAVGPRDGELHDALAALPRRQRACVVLRFYDEMSIAEVAETLGLATGTVKRYLSEAMHRLESQLGPVGEVAVAEPVLTESVLAQPALITGDHR